MMFSKGLTHNIQRREHTNMRDMKQSGNRRKFIHKSQDTFVCMSFPKCGDHSTQVGVRLIPAVVSLVCCQHHEVCVQNISWCGAHASQQWRSNFRVFPVLVYILYFSLPSSKQKHFSQVSTTTSLVSGGVGGGDMLLLLCR